MDGDCILLRLYRRPPGERHHLTTIFPMNSRLAWIIQGFVFHGLLFRYII